MQTMVKSLRDRLGDDVCGTRFIFAEPKLDSRTTVHWSEAGNAVSSSSLVSPSAESAWWPHDQMKTPSASQRGSG